MIQVLSADQLRVRSSALGAEVNQFMTGLRVGEGGLLELPVDKRYGYGRQTVKETIKAAAAACGHTVRFRRADKDRVIFERVR